MVTMKGICGKCGVELSGNGVSAFDKKIQQHLKDAHVEQLRQVEAEYWDARAKLAQLNIELSGYVQVGIYPRHNWTALLEENADRVDSRLESMNKLRKRAIHNASLVRTGGESE